MCTTPKLGELGSTKEKEALKFRDVRHSYEFQKWNFGGAAAGES